MKKSGLYIESDFCVGCSDWQRHHVNLDFKTNEYLYPGSGVIGRVKTKNYSVARLSSKLIPIATFAYDAVNSNVSYRFDSSVRALRVPLAMPLDPAEMYCSLHWVRVSRAIASYISVPMLYDGNRTVWIPQPVGSTNQVTAVIRHPKLTWVQRVRGLTGGA